MKIFSNEQINCIVHLDENFICIGGFKNIYIYDLKLKKIIFEYKNAHFSNVGSLKVIDEYLLSGKNLIKGVSTDIFKFIR